MKKNWILISLILVIALVIVLVVTQTKKEPGNIKIGAILPLTGDFASIGNEIKKGIEIGVDEAKGNGQSLVMFYEDDQSLSPVAAINSANKLILVDNIDVGLTMLVEESRPVSPIFTKNKVPLLILWDSNRFIKEAGSYIFSNGFSTEKAGELMAEFSFSTLGLKNIAIISHVDPWAKIISQAFGDKLKNLGGTIGHAEEMQSSETDYRTSITKIKKTNPDGIYMALVPPNSALFIIQSRELGLRVPLLTGDALIQDVINAAGESSEGIYLTNIYSESSEANLLKQKYRAKYKSDPLDINLVSFGYDGITKVVAAVASKQKSLQEALFSIFGESRSSDRPEKIFWINKGIPSEIK
jgi:branched-chain amino acid transport system substrate-binding protein